MIQLYEDTADAKYVNERIEQFLSYIHPFIHNLIIIRQWFTLVCFGNYAYLNSEGYGAISETFKTRKWITKWILY